MANKDKNRESWKVFVVPTCATRKYHFDIYKKWCLLIRVPSTPYKELLLSIAIHHHMFSLWSDMPHLPTSGPPVLNLFHFVCMGVSACLNVYLCTMCMPGVKVRNGYRIPENWSYRTLSSKRAACTIDL